MVLNVKSVCIVGGGSAGWMTATTLIRRFPDFKVTLIESPDIATVGVGESTVGGITNWMKLVDIAKDERDFMRETDATYKLAIGFQDFYLRCSGQFFYPFGSPVPQTKSNRAGHPSHAWYIKKIMKPETPWSEYAECMNSQMGLVMKNRFSKNERNLFPGFSAPGDIAYQFDATKFGIWLRDRVCLPEGLEWIKSTVSRKNIIPDANGIDKIILNDGKQVRADLFIDCTGFRSLLLGDVMGVEFESCEDFIPNNRAWATKIPYTDPSKQILNYTMCSAVENGWIWEIPLWSRLGCGYVYSDRFISDEEALLQFHENLIAKGYNNPDKLEYKNIKMRNGKHKKLWHKNVLAIGLAAGFIEPLESNGLYTTHEFLKEMCHVLEHNAMVNEWDRIQFNGKVNLSFTSFKEFVALHYMYSHRNDTEYWREITSREWYDLTDTTNQGFPLLQIPMAFHDKWGSSWGWTSDEPRSGTPYIATGMQTMVLDKTDVDEIWPINAKNIYDDYKNEISELDSRRKRWFNQAESCPTNYEYLKKNIYNET